MFIRRTGIKIKTGKLSAPDGTEFVGFKISSGAMFDPSKVKRTTWFDDMTKDGRWVCEGEFPNLSCRWVETQEA